MLHFIYLHSDSQNVDIFVPYMFSPSPSPDNTHTHTQSFSFLFFFFSESFESRSQTCNFAPTHFSVYFLKMMTLSYLTTVLLIYKSYINFVNYPV